jgi:multidrug efflux pump
MMERTTTIRASLRDAGRTLALSVALVVLVVFLFLRHGRAALIPSVAVPVSLIGTFGVMYLFDYSLDNLSLMALTIATGFVVDDAIVVLENCSRHIEAGMPPMEAARLGAGEVGFTVLAMTLSLVAVFIPLLLMGGFVGRFFREFAVVLSAAILVSLVVSLTTTPMMCSRLLRSAKERQLGRFHQWSERVFEAVLRGYGRTLSWALDHGPITVLILVATVALNVYLYVIIPKGFFPQQDTGQLIGRIQADQSISFQAMRQKLADFIAIVRADPAVANVVGFTGGQQRNTGSMFVTLKPLSEREDSAERIVARLRKELGKEPGANLFLTPVQDIRVGGRQSNATYQYTIQADDLAELTTWEPRIRQALSQLPELVDVNTDQQNKGLSTSLVIDRDAAARLGVTPKLIDATLNDAFAQRTVLDDLLAAQPVLRRDGGRAGVLAVRRRAQPDVRERAGRRAGPSVDVRAVSADGDVARRQSPFAIRRVDNLVQPAGRRVAVAGDAGDRRRARPHRRAHDRAGQLPGIGTRIPGGARNPAGPHPRGAPDALHRAGGAVRELRPSAHDPLDAPSAGVGALVALMLFRTDFSIIALIGVIMLIGIVQKNAIMMIDFALAAERTRDVPTREAIFEACLLRFRPIMMTTLSALLAAIPLALGRGDGAELRQPLGIAIGGGLILSQLLTLYTTPIVYLYLDRLSDRARALSPRDGAATASRRAPWTRRNDRHSDRRAAHPRKRRYRWIGRRGRVVQRRARLRPSCRRCAGCVQGGERQRGAGTSERAAVAQVVGSSSAIRISMRSSRRWRSTTRRSSRRKPECGRRKR